MTLKEWTEKVHSWQQYVEELLQKADFTEEQPGVIQRSIEELQVALEELRVAEEELREQNEHLYAAHEAVALERQRYQDLFEFAPDGYLVTAASGVIQEANHTAAQLLNTPGRFLLGRITFTTSDRVLRHASGVLAGRSDRIGLTPYLPELAHDPSRWSVLFHCERGLTVGEPRRPIRISWRTDMIVQ